jgi:hypothetical protein
MARRNEVQLAECYTSNPLCLFVTLRPHAHFPSIRVSFPGVVTQGILAYQTSRVNLLKENPPNEIVLVVEGTGGLTYTAGLANNRTFHTQDR